MLGSELFWVLLRVVYTVFRLRSQRKETQGRVGDYAVLSVQVGLQTVLPVIGNFSVVFNLSDLYIDVAVVLLLWYSAQQLRCQKRSQNCRFIV